MITNEIKNEIVGIKKQEEKIKGKDIKYEAKNYIYDFQQYETIRSVSESIYTPKARRVEAEKDQSNLIWQNLMINLDQDQKKVSKKRDTYESVNALYEGRELTVNAFKSEIFSIKQHKVKGSKYELLNKYFKDYQ